MKFTKCDIGYSILNRSKITGYQTEDGKIFCVGAGELPYSWLTGGMPIFHWVISEQNSIMNFIDPSYETRVSILESIGKWRNVAVEVYPAKSNLVDREPVYHLWEFEFPYSMPQYMAARNVLSTYNRPGKYFDGKYMILLTDKKCWRDKQAAKDHFFGEEATGVEIISREFSNFDLTAIVLTGELDFGLL